MLATMSASAQTDKVPTGADYLTAYKKADCTIAFDVNAEGEPFRVKWGMDTAWNWDFNVYKGIAHNATGNFETGRISFQPNDLVTDNGDGTYTLSTRQKNALKSRIANIKLTGTKAVNINCDHEMLFKDEKGNEDFTGRSNYQGKPEEWYKLIKATTQYTISQGLEVVSVSPFNESDYVNWQQYSGNESNGMKDFLAICKLLKADDYFKNIRVCGGNTLNCDRALPWYNYLKDYIDEGNTHQLAGSFDTYAKFFSTVKADGKVGTADELHNVGEAIVGVNYGMENGIWWGFDSKARGQFMIDSNEGKRIGYGEDRAHWTSGAIYRNEKTGEIHGFLGSSERQANNSTFQFVSTTKDVFFNGVGPTRHWSYELPGGTGYQIGQINAELLFDITYGEDVAPMGIVDGTFQILNAYSNKLLTMNGGSDLKIDSRKSTGNTQKWHVYPKQVNGDVSYWVIDNAGSANSHLNAVLDWGNMKGMFVTGGRVITYTNTGRPDEEQWYLKYVKNGYYLIINRLTNKCLYSNSNSSGAIVSLKPLPNGTETEAILNRYLWRFMPQDAKIDIVAPEAPTGLAARQRANSIELSWIAPADEENASYTVLRGIVDENGNATEWNTIARQITAAAFIDNSVVEGQKYAYKVITVDYVGNRSKASEIINAATLNEKAMICQLQFDNALIDNTANQINAALNGTEKYSLTSLSSLRKSGTSALQLDGKTYAIMPYSVSHLDEITIATWVRWKTASNWQRVFDFGNGSQQYMFFTPSNGSEMRFVMKDKGEEQILTTGKRLPIGAWKHVAVTLKPIDGGKMQAVLYIDGEAVAQSEDFTIKPSDIAASLCYIGRSMFDSDPMFDGHIDDFRVYNYALSADEVKAITEDLGEVAADYKDSFEDVVTSISKVSAGEQSANSNIYDLNGRQIAAPDHGIYIKNNKKILK